MKINAIVAKLDTSDVGVVNISAEKLVGNILNTAYLIAGIVAVVMIIYAGIQYTTSSGDAKKVEQAKNTILYSIIGLVVVLLAFFITWYVIGRF